MILTPYVIKRERDADSCDVCESPLIVGSLALWNRGAIYCSEACAHDSRPTEAPPAISSQGVYAQALIR